MGPVDVADFEKLGLNRLCDVAIAMTHADHEGPRRSIDVALTLPIEEVDPLAVGNDRHVPRQVAEKNVAFWEADDVGHGGRNSEALVSSWKDRNASRFSLGIQRNEGDEPGLGEAPGLESSRRSEGCVEDDFPGDAHLEADTRRSKKFVTS